jgi:thiazolylpeptide-type bacteriocin precursor
VTCESAAFPAPSGQGEAALLYSGGSGSAMTAVIRAVINVSAGTETLASVWPAEHYWLCSRTGCAEEFGKEFKMSINDIKNDDADKAFESFDVDELETLEVAQGVALPEMGASSGSIGTSSSSSSTCSAC